MADDKTDPQTDPDAICSAFLSHLDARFDRPIDSGGAIQLSIRYPNGDRIFDVSVSDGLEFRPAREAKPGRSQLVLGHRLVRRLMRGNEFMCPRDYDVRRDCWFDDRDPLSWAMLQAGFRPNTWAERQFCEAAAIPGEVSRPIHTLSNPSVCEVLRQIAARQPCKLKYDQLTARHRPAELARLAKAHYQFCQEKELNDRAKYLTGVAPPDMPPQASYRMEQTAKLWSKFGIPFYGWTSFACLELVAWADDTSRGDLYPVQSALTEFRLCTAGKIKVSLVPDRPDKALTPFRGYGSLRYCRTADAGTESAITLTAGDLLLIPPGWYSGTRALAEGSISASHYWRHA